MDKCNCMFRIDYNDHKSCNESVMEYLSEFGQGDVLDDIEKTVLEKMIETDTVIMLQIYPNHSVSFFWVWGYDMDMVLTEALANL